MTYNEFIDACCERLIEPSIVLENESIRDALSVKDDQKVIEILDNEF